MDILILLTAIFQKSDFLPHISLFAIRQSEFIESDSLGM
jgi:hypothetical protein